MIKSNDWSDINCSGQTVGQFELCTRKAMMDASKYEAGLRLESVDKLGAPASYWIGLSFKRFDTEESALIAAAEYAESLINDGYFSDSFDESAILAAIISSRGKNKGKLRSSRPKYGRDRASKLAYYVWRMARFHGGIDYCMPIAAAFDVYNETLPTVAKLDALVDKVALESFGSNMRAAKRWHKAFYG